MRRRAVAAVALLLVAAACGDGDVARRVTEGRGVGPLRLLGEFLGCVSAEADVDPFSGQLLDQLGQLRELDPEDDSVRAAIRTCFPKLAATFTDAGLRPPTQGELAAPDGPAAPSEPSEPSEPGAPVVQGDFADPFLLPAGGEQYLYATNTLGRNVPVARFDDTGVVSAASDALPELPDWTEPGAVWAPSVVEVPGGWVLYYTTRDVASGLQCLSVASAADPIGPFTDDSDAPLICQTELGGSIDPSPYRDGDRRWLVWKSDGNCCELATQIFVQETSADGRSVVGEPTALLGVDQSWEGELVEGPALVAADRGLLLFYSANRWDTADYAVGYATCESVTGPCVKPREDPWLRTYALAAGPGGQELSVGPDGPVVAYHGWSPEAVGYDAGGVRRLYVEPVDLAARPPGLSFPS